MFKINNKTKPWPDGREYLGTVHSSQGPLRVFMPTYGDMLPFKDKDLEGFAHGVAAKAIGLTTDDFLNLSYPDASSVMLLVSEALKKLKPLVSKDK